MASVLKRLHNFKTSPFPTSPGKRSPSPCIPEGGKDGRCTPEIKDLPEDFTEDCELTNDLLHRRKVSISKSGRYKENHRKRSAILDETKRQIVANEVMTPPTSTSSSSSKDDSRTTFSIKDKEEKNKENEMNKENILVRRDSIISDTDGHAVADEIESLAKKLALENGQDTPL